MIVTEEISSCPWADYRPSSARAHTALLAHLAKQLRWLHDHGIAHGDLELKNLLLDCRTGLATIIDFEKSKRRASVADKRRDKQQLAASLSRIAKTDRSSRSRN